MKRSFLAFILTMTSLSTAIAREPKASFADDLDSWVGVYEVISGETTKFSYAIVYKDRVLVAQKGQEYDRYSIAFSDSLEYKAPNFPYLRYPESYQNVALIGLSIYKAENGDLSSYTGGFSNQLPDDHFFASNANGHNLNWPLGWAGTGAQKEIKSTDILKISKDGTEITHLDWRGKVAKAVRALNATTLKVTTKVLKASMFGEKEVLKEHKIRKIQ